MDILYSDYMQEWEVKPGLDKEFVTLWPAWLGKDNLHKLDEVTETDWSRFNNFVRLLSKTYDLFLIDCDRETVVEIEEVEDTLSSYSASMNKGAADFSKFVIPELDCVLTEEWDYTYIIWHKGNGALQALTPFIAAAGLHSFKG